MNRTFKRLIGLLLAVLLGLGLMGCTSAEEEQAAFEAYLEELFIDTVTSDTVTLHFTLKNPEEMGIEEMEPTLGEISVEQNEQDNRDFEETYAEFQRFDRKKLTQDQQQTYDVLAWYFEVNDEMKGLELYSELSAPKNGLHVQIPQTLSEYRLEDREDVEEYLALLKQIPDYFGQLLEYQKVRAEQGLFLNASMQKETVQECRDYAKNTQSCNLILSFEERIEGIEGLTEEEKQGYIQENQSIVTQTVLPAYQTLADGLEQLTPSENEKGLAYLPEGKEYYAGLIRYYTGTDMTPEEMIEYTEAKIEERMNGMIRAVAQDPEVIDRFGHYDFEQSAEEMLKELEEKSKEDFPEIQEIHYTVKQVNPALEDSYNPAFYFIPPVDDEAENSIYVNNKYLGEGATMNIYSTLAHEGYPGHLYQVNYYLQTDPEWIRTQLSFGGYDEGWGTYAEYYGLRYQCAEDEALADLSVANSELSMMLYCRVDLGVHYEGWGEEETADYLKSYFEADVAKEIYQAMLEDPGVYLKYGIGYEQFYDLRERAQEELGEEYDDKAFHQAVLDIGPAPFSMVGEAVDAYISENR